MTYKVLDTSQASAREIQAVLTSAISPRPIAFASTVDKEGNYNLSPFSFFNAFGANPPILIFSPARRGLNNTTKHTYDNIKEVPEVVINMVSYAMVEQMSLSSSDFAKGVNEFEKAGFTAIASDTIRPMRVMEAPVQFECKVQQVIETGDQGGAGNLVICHVTKIHIAESVLDADGNIDTQLIDLVGRMGGNEYVRVKDASFTIAKPTAKVGIGIDALPDFIRTSSELSGNQLARLGGEDRLPAKADSAAFANLSDIEKLQKAKSLLAEEQSWDALCCLMA
jgi:flavin reductase (DIM6/NTAB) family NADH-FMN oxidoreductase RutF